jgi:hypothetical protein
MKDLTPYQHHELIKSRIVGSYNNASNLIKGKSEVKKISSGVIREKPPKIYSRSKNDSGGQYSISELTCFAKETPLHHLKRTIIESPDENMRKVAQAEIKRRSQQDN